MATFKTAPTSAALASVPLRAGQSAASRQAVLQQLAFLQEVYGGNPVFRNTTTTSVIGHVPGDPPFGITC